MPSKGKCKSVTCTNSAKKNKNLAFHKFPSNDEVCANWIRACQQPEIFSAKHSAMCEDHFVPSDYAGKCHFISLFVLKYRSTFLFLHKNQVCLVLHPNLVA